VPLIPCKPLEVVPPESHAWGEMLSMIVWKADTVDARGHVQVDAHHLVPGLVRDLIRAGDHGAGHGYGEVPQHLRALEAHREPVPVHVLEHAAVPKALEAPGLGLDKERIQARHAAQGCVLVAVGVPVAVHSQVHHQLALNAWVLIVIGAVISNRT
jgi:hypothetical protein